MPAIASDKEICDSPDAPGASAIWCKRRVTAQAQLRATTCGGVRSRLRPAAGLRRATYAALPSDSGTFHDLADAFHKYAGIKIRKVGRCVPTAPHVTAKVEYLRGDTATITAQRIGEPHQIADAPERK